MKAKKNSIYTPQSIIGLVVIFTIFFALLYSVGSYLHKSQKLQEEIDKIIEANQAAEKEIEKKRKKITYLKTPQRLEKDAKIQMAKKLPGEKVYVFSEEKILTPETEKIETREPPKLSKNMPSWQKWILVFWDKPMPKKTETN